MQAINKKRVREIEPVYSGSVRICPRSGLVHFSSSNDLKVPLIFKDYKSKTCGCLQIPLAFPRS